MYNELRADPTFEPDDVPGDLQDRLRSPIPVSVLMRGGDVGDTELWLGIGHIIGSIQMLSGRVAVIEIRDGEDTHALLETECEWTYPPIPTVAEGLMDTSTATIVMNSLRQYASEVSAQREANKDEEERDWLVSQGIESESW